MTRDREHRPGVRLLVLFDALVRRDVDQPGLSGRIAAQVDDTWWRADFNDGSRTEFSDSPLEADVVLKLSVPAAEAVLLSGALPEPGAFALEGDGALFTKFIKRFTQKRSWLDIRAG